MMPELVKINAQEGFPAERVFLVRRFVDSASDAAESVSASELPITPVYEVTSLPSTDKATWIAETLNPEELLEMARELLIEAIHACTTGNLTRLAQTIADWESTAEILSDEQLTKEILLSMHNSERGPSWKEMRQNLGLK